MWGPLACRYFFTSPSSCTLDLISSSCPFSLHSMVFTSEPGGGQGQHAWPPPPAPRRCPQETFASLLLLQQLLVELERLPVVSLLHHELLLQLLRGQRVTWGGHRPCRWHSGHPPAVFWAHTCTGPTQNRNASARGTRGDTVWEDVFRGALEWAPRGDAGMDTRGPVREQPAQNWTRVNLLQITGQKRDPWPTVTLY